MLACRYILWFTALAAGCGTDAADDRQQSDDDDGVVSPDASSPGEDAPSSPDGAPFDRAQVPPQGRSELDAWLAEGHYLAWACEDSAHPARPPGAHGTNRICSNGALSTASTGTFPIGAASVKELYSGAAISGYAVGLKVTGGTDPDSWYWYERLNTTIYADGIGVGLCANCHDGAPRDYVFTRVVP